MNSIMVKTLLGVTLALNASNNASNNAQRQQEQQTNSSGNDRDKLWDKLWDKLNKPFCENNKPPYSSLHNFCCDNKEMFSDNYQPLFLRAESYSDCQSEFNSLHKMDGDQKFSDLLWGSYGIVNKANEACDVQFGSIFEDATCHELDKIAKLKNESDNYESFEKSCIEVLGEIDSQYQVSFKHLMDFLTPQAKEEKERRKCSDKVDETASGSGKIGTSDTHSGNFFDNIDFVPIGVVIAVIAAVIAVSGLAYYCFYCTNGTNGTNGGQGDANTNPNGKGPNDDDIDNTNKIVIGNNEKAENNIEDTNANGTKNKAVQCDKPTDKGNNENGENTCLTSLFRYCISSGQDGKVDNKDNPDGQDVDANTNTNQIDMDANNDNNDNNDNNVNPNANNDNNVNPNGTNGGQGDANTNPNQIDMDANNDNNDNNVNPNANGTNNVYNENN